MQQSVSRDHLRRPANWYVGTVGQLTIMRYVEIDASNPIEVETIRKLLFDAYIIEAEVIGVLAFPPLRRDAANIRETDAKFVGCDVEGTLVAVAELERGDDNLTNIASFAVHPSMFRRGIGSFLLTRIVQAHGRAPITVSTAMRNTPAISLYKKHRFRSEKRWSTACGIDMVTLVRAADTW
jgi:ribosomal protein S18 acetylase RimI-like enzyme